MKISVYDTYVNKDDGSVMHFDILVESSKTLEDALAFGKEYLDLKGLGNSQLTAKECNYCHMEMASLEIENIVSTKGYYIIEMENC